MDIGVLSEVRLEATLDALGSPTRRQIVRLLAPGPKSVGEIAAELPVSRPAVSKHLRLLETAELVAHRSEGNRNVFQLRRSGFDSARDWLESFWDDALARLKLEAENDWKAERTSNSNLRSGGEDG